MKILVKKVKLYDFTSPVSNAEDEQVGKQTPIAVRFSTVGGESGSADTARCQKRSERTSSLYFYCQCGIFTTRDPRGFAVKFYTEEGNWDIVGNNTPIFFIR